MTRSIVLVGFLIIHLLTFAQSSSFKIADVFTNQMIIQRHSDVKIWGNAESDTRIDLIFNGQNVSTKAKNGKWVITLAPMNHGGPLSMQIKNEGQTIILNDIYIGDVWLAGGQSNMEFPLRRVSNAKQEIDQANYPLIRYYKVPRKFYEGHQVDEASWSICSPKTASEFSAMAYYFARNLYQELDVPIGIIQTPVGGTTAEAWMSRMTLESNSEFQPILAKYDSIVDSYNGTYVKVYDEFKKKLAAYNSLATHEQKNKMKPVEPMGEYNFRRPVGVYEYMLQSVVPYTLKGFIFYQGESNTGRGHQYQTLFPALIKEWRNCWKQGNIPFLYVQLPCFETKTRNWEELREAQYLTLHKVKNTGMIVAFDQGNPKDIHPTVKDTLGWRLSQLALGKVYGKKIVYQGPEFKKVIKTKEGLSVEFINTGSGLIAKNGAKEIIGFMVAGVNGSFYPAKAKIIDSNRILLQCAEVEIPIYIRYLWINSSEVNLFNKEGFPALPFRTDRFTLRTLNINS